MVHVAEDAEVAFAIWWKQPAKQRFAQLELPILPAGLAQVPDKVDAVRDRRHQGESVPRRPDPVVILRDSGVGGAAGVGGVVPRAVVFNGPVPALTMAMRARRVDVTITTPATP